MSAAGDARGAAPGEEGRRDEPLLARSLAYWSARAPEFSGLRRRDYDSPLREAYTRLLRDHLPPPPARVLDAGTGAGLFALILAGLGYEVIAIDFSDAMLEEARANLATHSLADRVDLRRMDVQDLDLPDGGVDAVVSHNVTWVLPAPESAYAQMLRVLRPGGVLLNVDANYGAVFAAADAAGETPRHVTQDTAQLRERNDIAAGLWISRVPRPAWDVGCVLDLGIASVTVLTDVDAEYGTADLNKPYASASDRRAATPFALVARR